jgi:hypothetical protein
MDPIAAWTALLRPERELTAEYAASLADAMRQRKLTFGDRVHCPVLRPFFLTAADETRIRIASETIAAIGERVVAAAMDDARLLAALGVTEPESRLIRIDPGYARASTASRLDAFLLPDSLHFAEYNAESPAGPAYTQRLCELFDGLEPMTGLRRDFRVGYHATIPPLLAALLDSYRDWGGTASPPTVAIVDFRGVPTWTEFELLRDAFVEAGVPTVVCDPRELTFEGGALRNEGQRIDLVYRRVLLNDILARPDDCASLVAACEQRAVCVANTFRCKIPHKKAFFAILTDERYHHLFDRADLEAVREHVPWTRLVDEEIAARVRRGRERFVLKPNDEYGGTGVTLGWETAAGAWDAALDRAVRDGGWIAQERIEVRREVFPICDGSRVVDRNMLVDFAPYVFRGRVAGYLTRLSATGLANVTSGGGQVPAFVVDPLEPRSSS